MKHLRRQLIMKLRSLVLVLVSTAVFAAKPSSNIPVTTYLSDTNANTGAAYYIQSDGMIGPVHGALGEYDNGYQSVGSYLNANTYNQEPPGDWTLDLLSSSV